MSCVARDKQGVLMSQTPGAPVPNPYLAALRQARTVVEPLTVALDANLNPVRTAMNQGAWISASADTFFAELSEHIRSLGRAADGSLQNLDEMISGREPMVDPGSPDGRWWPR